MSLFLLIIFIALFVSVRYMKQRLMSAEPANSDAAPFDDMVSDRPEDNPNSYESVFPEDDYAATSASERTSQEPYLDNEVFSYESAQTFRSPRRKDPSRQPSVSSSTQQAAIDGDASPFVFDLRQAVIADTILNNHYINDRPSLS